MIGINVDPLDLLNPISSICVVHVHDCKGVSYVIHGYGRYLHNAELLVEVHTCNNITEQLSQVMYRCVSTDDWFECPASEKEV